MALLSCNWSSRISIDVLVTESFIPTCKIMTSGFFFKIRIIWWLISTKVAPLVSCPFTKQFLLSLFSSTPVIIVSHYNAGTCRSHFFRGGLIYSTIFIRKFKSCCFLKKIELLTLLLSVVSYLFINFGEACRNACTVLFIFNSLLHRTADGGIFSLELDGVVTSNKLLLFKTTVGSLPRLLVMLLSVADSFLIISSLFSISFLKLYIRPMWFENNL